MLTFVVWLVEKKNIEACLSGAQVPIGVASFKWAEIPQPPPACALHATFTLDLPPYFNLLISLAFIKPATFSFDESLAQPGAEVISPPAEHLTKHTDIA